MKSRRRRSRRSARIARSNPRRRRRAARVARRNPSRRRRSVRSLSRRNPGRRRTSRRFSRRNPGSEIIGAFTNQDILTTAGGLLAGTIVAPLIVSKLTKPGSMLPGLDPTKNPSPFYRTLYKVVIAGGAGLLLRRKMPRASDGLLLSALGILGTDVLQQSGLMTKINTAAGVSRYYPPAKGAGSYLPGTNPIFTGPGSGFLNRSNVPMPRRHGAAAPVNRQFARSLPGLVQDPFNTN